MSHNWRHRENAALIGVVKRVNVGVAVAGDGNGRG